MNKIPTLFVRDVSRPQFVTPAVTPGCEWVLAGEGVATRKFDGTNVRVVTSCGELVAVNKRRNPTREEKAQGGEPGYVMASRDDPSDKHIFAAVDAADFSSWPDGTWPCEAVGPKIQGGADGLPASLVAFSLPSFVKTAGIPGAPRSFEALDSWLWCSGYEGIVWHHPDGRMAKIKARDFGHRWPSKPQPETVGVRA
jgi:hypothetical protein